MFSCLFKLAYWQKLHHLSLVNIYPNRGVGAAGIHGALDRRPFLIGRNLTILWNPGPG